MSAEGIAKFVESRYEAFHLVGIHNLQTLVLGNGAVRVFKLRGHRFSLADYMFL